MTDVGIVMPVYVQSKEYFVTAVNSILRQSYPNFRLIIVMDGAPKRLIKIARQAAEKDKRVKVIVSKRNQGIAEALNLGFSKLLRKPEIEFLTWVSSDNVYYPHFIAKLRKALKNSPDSVGLAYSGFRHVNQVGKPLYAKSFYDKLRKFQQQPKEALVDQCFIGASFMYKKKYALSTGPYRKHTIDDYDYWLRLTERCDIHYMPKILMDYRVKSPHSVSTLIGKSKENHRKWRFQLQSLKHEARVRRKIPFETTVIFAVHDHSEETIQQYEALLEQEYSNYRLVVLDLTPNSTAHERLKQIIDPRAMFILSPSLPKAKATIAALMQVNTPFTLIYDGTKPIRRNHLQRLAAHMKQSSQTIQSAMINGDAITVSLNLPNELKGNEMYRTQKLLTVLKKHIPL